MLQVEQLLLDDPENAEYKDIYDGLQEVRCSNPCINNTIMSSIIDILMFTCHFFLQVTKLTKDLLEAARAEEIPGKESPSHQQGPVAAITKAPEVKVPSILPPQVKEQIRIAQQRAALAGQAPPEWAIGASVQGRYSGDGKWYAGEITAISAAGKFIVYLNQYNVREEMELEDLRQNGVADEHGKNLSGYQGQLAN
jgi:survival-of-motor-neuron-related-splicing factor 30